MKKKITLNYDDEIDLVALFKVMWGDKIKILVIILISFLVGVLYSYKTPNNYLIKVTLTKSKDFPLNRINFISQLLTIIKKKETNLTDETELTKETNKIILNKFYKEFEDFEEFLLNLKNIATTKENLSNTINKSKFNIEFKWDNNDEAKDILHEAINLTSKNLKKSTLNEINVILEQKIKLTQLRDFKNSRFLKEQRLIAKQLDISNPVDGYTGDPYYLRGYLAIDNEIESIEKREYQEFEIIKQEIEYLKNESYNWIDYDVAITDLKLFKNTNLILIVSILLGLIFAAFYVVISDALKSKTLYKKKTIIK